MKLTLVNLQCEEMIIGHFWKFKMIIHSTKSKFEMYLIEKYAMYYYRTIYMVCLSTQALLVKSVENSLIQFSFHVDAMQIRNKLKWYKFFQRVVSI